MFENKINKSNNMSHPITSYGIINFKFTDEFEKYNTILKDKYIIKDYNPTVNKINLYWFNNKNINKTEMTEEGRECNELIERLKNSILFLMISRKHSLGFIEFIRGKYEIDKIETIKYLFDQMTENEISKILNEEFKTLWCDLWQKTAKNKTYEKEYYMSLEKFNEIKEKYLAEIIEFRPKYPISEWRFPKGKKNNLEKDIECAARECHEETSLELSEISILDRIYPISEQFKGTNDIDYKHIYYLSIIESNRNLNCIVMPDEFIEVDNVGWFKYDRVMNIIRPYHNEKKKLVDDIIKFIAYNILWIESLIK